jgi:hypothetical protein
MDKVVIVTCNGHISQLGFRSSEAAIAWIMGRSGNPEHTHPFSWIFHDDYSNEYKVHEIDIIE